MLGNENAVLRFTKEPPPPITPLSGSFWQFDGFMMGDDFRPLLSGSVITAEMAEGVIRGSSGCNAYGADYEVDGDLISVGETVQTAMLCLDNEVMEQETAYVSALGAAHSFSFDEYTLSIDYNGGQLLFSKPLTDVGPFTDTLWHLVDLIQGGETGALPDQAGITAQFDGREVTGWTGCNQYLGAYTARDTSLTIGYIQATEEGCPDDMSASLERTLLSDLEQATFDVRITEGELTLANVEATLVFSAIEPAPSGSTGIPAVDEAVATILTNDLAARRELVRFTTAGCTTVMGLGGPPKCEEGQAEGAPVEYFPVLGPGEGATILPEEIDRILDVQMKRLYAAFRRSDDPEADPFYSPGAYGLIFEASRGESVPCFVVRLDAEGHIVRLDYLMFSAQELIGREATDLLAPADGERCDIAAIGPPGG
jgi:heat shock protein HslJ